MKKTLAPIAIFCTFFFLMGMGELGGSSPAGKIPAPEKNFNVRVVDREGIQTSLSQFSQDGKVFLAGRRGEATVTIPFEKIAQIQFGGLEGKDVQAKVSLRGQETVDIRVDKQSKFFGKADFGTFQIEVKDVRSVHFLP